jgi:protein gp37/ParB-like chromosome segregation protein Spo0J
MTKLGPYEVHPFADAFPLIEGNDFEELIADIKRQGLRTPIVLSHDGKVLIDGRNRWRACDAAGVDAVFEKLPERYTEAMILDFIVSTNMARRHLNPGQRAAVAFAYKGAIAASIRAAEVERKSKFPSHPKTDTTVADLRQSQPKMSVSEQPVTIPSERKASAQAARVTGASPRAVQQFGAVQRDTPDLAEKVRSGELALDAADKQRKQRKLQKRHQPEPKTATAPPTAPATTGPVMVTLRTHKGDPVLVPPRKSKAMFNETSGAGISWASWSWNPVTGCLHGCDYCYARDIATQEKMRAIYPVGFTPLFREDRLEAPANTTIPAQHRDDPAWRRVFVCSMADLYGRWVPDEWIERVHSACLASQQWDYIHLTKFPSRYVGLDFSPSSWVGTSVDEQKRVRIAEDAFRQIGDVKVKWLSLEPLREPLQFTDLSMFDWVVIGAQTQTCQPSGVVPAFAPPFEWVARIVAQAREAGCRVHLKPNLLGRTSPDFPGMQMPDEYPLLGAPRPLPVLGEIPGQTAIAV